MLTATRMFDLVLSILQAVSAATVVLRSTWRPLNKFGLFSSPSTALPLYLCNPSVAPYVSFSAFLVREKCIQFRGVDIHVATGATPPCLAPGFYHANYKLSSSKHAYSDYPGND